MEEHGGAWVTSDGRPAVVAATVRVAHRRADGGSVAIWATVRRRRSTRRRQRVGLTPGVWLLNLVGNRRVKSRALHGARRIAANVPHESRPAGMNALTSI